MAKKKSAKKSGKSAKKKTAKKKASKPAKKKAAKKSAGKCAKKKSVKKKAGAKSAEKPKVKVTVKKKILGKAPEEKTFYLKDGRELRTIYELIDELETMSEDMFRHHVNELENHFANWVEGVFEDKRLAEEMRELESQMEMQRAILKHLVREIKKVAQHKE